MVAYLSCGPTFRSTSTDRHCITETECARDAFRTLRGTGWKSLPSKNNDRRKNIDTLSSRTGDLQSHLEMRRSERSRYGLASRGTLESPEPGADIGHSSCLCRHHGGTMADPLIKTLASDSGRGRPWSPTSPILMVWVVQKKIKKH